MPLSRHYGGWVIVVTILAAFILAMMPLPGWLQPLRPSWVAMVLIYWVLALPERVGVVIGWCIGLFLDVAMGTFLGLHAAALALVCFLVLKLHQRMRLFPLWKQALSVMMLVGLQQMIVLWVKGISGQETETWWYWITPMTSMMFWPWTFIFLRTLRRYFHVS
jgi:rod shape-determining protein MreD